MTRVFFFTLRLHLQVYCTGCVYKTSLRSASLNGFMGRFYGSGFHAKFTDQVYTQTLLVLFTGLVYLLTFVLPFKPSLWIKFTYHVLQVKGFSQVYELTFSVLIMVHILRGQILCRFYK